ncbi:MAG: MarR family transcriptional regulator [Bacteroidota bacterium]
MGDVLLQRLQQTKPFESAAHEAMLNLFVASSYLRQQMEHMCQQHGITMTQYNVLRILRGAPAEGYARCDIIDRMLDRVPDVTRLVDRLVRMDLVERRPAEHDRRMKMHVITDEGRQLLDAMYDDVHVNQEHIAERISEDDLRTLSRICETLYSP